MAPLTLEQLCRNAYRTLGLAASASQADIDAAARRMRIWPDPSRIPPTPWDLPHLGLGPIARSKTDIEQAVAHLHDPETRLRQRLLWYHLSADPAPAASSIPAQHDDAIAQLHDAFVKDPDLRDKARWRSPCERLALLSGRDDFFDWLRTEEAAGQFEKPSSDLEIRDAIRSVPAQLAQSLTIKAQAALERGEAETSSGIVAILQAMQIVGGSDVAMTGLLDRLEDALDLGCRGIDGELREQLRTNFQHPQPFQPNNRHATGRANQAYHESIAPTLAQLIELSQADPDRILRAKVRCAEVLRLMAVGWEWGGDLSLAVQTLERARVLADQSPVAFAIDHELDRCRPMLEQQKRQGARTPEVQFRRPGTRPPPRRANRPKLVTGPIRGDAFNSRWVAIILISVASALIRLAMSSSSSSSSYSPSPSDWNEPVHHLEPVRDFVPDPGTRAPVGSEARKDWEPQTQSPPHSGDSVLSLTPSSLPATSSEPESPFGSHTP